MVLIGTGTCGLGAGAAAVLEAVRGFPVVQRHRAEIVEVGCIGLCASEPMLDVQLPGRTRLCFGRVDPQKARTILDAMLGQGAWPELPLFQFPVPGLQSWEGVPTIDEHPFFAPQTRLVLRNCGLIDPRSLDEYRARGGYRHGCGCCGTCRRSSSATRSSAAACAAAGAGDSPRAASGASPSRRRPSASSWSATPTRATRARSWTAP